MREVNTWVIEKSPEFLKALQAAQGNCDFYHQNRQEIWDTHLGSVVFVYGDHQIESFRDLEGFAEWHERLPAETRSSGMSFSRPKEGIWIL